MLAERARGELGTRREPRDVTKTTRTGTSKTATSDPVGEVTVAGYSHVAVMVDDLDAALDFYCDVLGFETLRRPDEFGPGAWLQLGTAQVHIGVVGEMPPKGTGLPHLALHIPAAVFDATMDALTARGVPFLDGPERPGGLRPAGAGGLHPGPGRQRHRAHRRRTPPRGPNSSRRRLHSGLGSLNLRFDVRVPLPRGE